MDSAVLAALITTPTAAIAAGAAYAAGRAQARGSVDAVRRVDQRTAYTQLRFTARAVLTQAERVMLSWSPPGVHLYPPVPPPTESPEELHRSLIEAVAHLTRAADALALEGPPRLAQLAENTSSRGTELLEAIGIATVNQTRFNRHRASTNAQLLKRSILDFNRTASHYLNSGRTFQWGTWWHRTVLRVRYRVSS
ncbi:hypothetical protein [Streptomyces albidoflavus]|uniref:hypothetical protein n=1 Tax=Streptomyces albidoflavus TaxID=1886 RepID=UPI00224D3D4A|nr:hypothetical protein [Streptomyces albidoflavus]MCX4444807.1 hypothetical protein [Streptomyces albidoflavus]